MKISLRKNKWWVYWIKVILDIDGNENKRGKVIDQNVVKNIKRKEYIDVLFNKNVVRQHEKDSKQIA